ncbi:hypothetical protein OWV82_022788 [Melia azedarach]|uniref:Uncharacterized protein n=1 Tax=Melia azedarach TaxID=155640 RepID=A0ACC1WXV8_MELAZ|nr:hypothetical protein OWV82_022788 [Melia azedarach]
MASSSPLIVHLFTLSSTLTLSIFIFSSSVSGRRLLPSTLQFSSDTSAGSKLTPPSNSMLLTFPITFQEPVLTSSPVQAVDGNFTPSFLPLPSLPKFPPFPFIPTLPFAGGGERKGKGGKGKGGTGKSGSGGRFGGNGNGGSGNGGRGRESTWSANMEMRIKIEKKKKKLKAIARGEEEAMDES